MGLSAWHSDHSRLPATPDVVAVWRVAMQTHRPLRDDEWTTLAPDEIARAERFKFDEPRIRLVRCRRALRTILGRWLQVDPAVLQFHYGEHGKPQLADTPLAPAFNVSHSHDWGLIAVTATGDLGIDVERIELRTTWNGLARRFFSASEVAVLEALPVEKQLAGFFHIWAGKEAFIKAVGRGLSFPLASFSVQGDPDQPPRLLAVENDPDAPQKWKMAAIPLPDDYAARAMWNGVARQIACFEFVSSP